MSTIKQIIPVVGDWFVMLRDENDPSSCNPHRVAAWALVQTPAPVVEEHVYPLISDEVNMMPMLVIPDSEDVVGIADGDSVREPGWQDQAKTLADAAVEEEERRIAHANIEEVFKKTIDGRHTVRDLLHALAIPQKQIPFRFDPKLAHQLAEDGVLKAISGGYALTKLGLLLLGRLNEALGPLPEE